MTRTSLFFAFAALLAIVALFPSPAQRDAAPSTPTVATPPPATPPMPSRAHAAQSTSLEGVTFSAKLGAVTLPESKPSEVFARIDLAAHEARRVTHRGRVSLALVLDRSGSMAGPKLVEAREAALKLIDALQPGDRLAVVHYGSDAVAIPSLEITAKTQTFLRNEVRAIRDNGGTNISAALEAGYQALAEVEGEYSARRVILISDGQPTEGVTDPRALLALASGIRERGVAVSALGVGVDFNDELMRGLATHGGGFYAYLKNAYQLNDILARELGQALNSVAQQVEVRLDPAPGIEVRDVNGFPFRREPDGTVVVQVYDLAVGQSARILAELSVSTASTSGPVLQPSLSFRTAARGDTVSAGLLLTASRTDDAALLEAARDAEIYADSLRVIGGRQIAEATRQLERGDRVRAFGIFDNVRSLFGSSAQALAGEISELDRAQQRLQGATSQDAIRAETKSVRKNLTNFGANNAY